MTNKVANSVSGAAAEQTGKVSTDLTIPASQWKWYGEAAHLIVGHDCRFHMATLIGKHMVSTVGKYWPDRAVREIFARSRGKEIVGRGEQWDNDYRKKMPNLGWEQIGCDRLYETMVFAIAGKNCPCGCGLPQIDGSELDFAGYNDPKEATKGHMAMCAKWARSVDTAQVSSNVAQKEK